VRHPAGPADGDRLRDLALLPLRLPLPARPPPGSARRSRGGRDGGRCDRHPALPAHPAAAADAGDRAAVRAALHHDVQQVRRRLPAHRRRLRHGCRGGARVRLPHLPLRRRCRGGAGPGARRRPDGAARHLLQVLRPEGAGGGLMTRAQFEDRFFRIARWVVIAFLAAITLVPFSYMVMLSLKPIDALLVDPGSLWVSAEEFTLTTYRDVLKSTDDGGQGFLRLMLNSALVSLGTVA